MWRKSKEGPGRQMMERGELEKERKERGRERRVEERIG